MEMLRGLNKSQRFPSPSPPPKEDFRRLGSGERNPAEGGRPRGPSERERTSHWAGVRGKEPSQINPPKTSTHFVTCQPIYINFPGFKIPFGSNASFTFRCNSRVSFETASVHHGFFAKPIPCSPVILPPHATTC